MKLSVPASGPQKVMDRKQPCKGLRKEIRPQERRNFKVNDLLRFRLRKKVAFILNGKEEHQQRKHD